MFNLMTVSLGVKRITWQARQRRLYLAPCPLYMSQHAMLSSLHSLW
jgi:hypothetical protein